MSLLPVDDDWQAGGIPLGALGLWERCRPWVGSTAHADLFSGYQRLVGLDGLKRGMAVFAKDPSFAGDDWIPWALFRPWISVDQEIWLSWSHMILRGSANSDSFRNVGLAARLQGGTLSGTGQAQGIDNLTGYIWLFRKTTAGSPYEHVLSRLNAGVATTLQTIGETTNGTDPPPGSNTHLVAPRRFRFVVRNEGANVRLEGYQINYGVSMSETLVFSILDSSASKITTAGRAGFSLQTPRTDSGGAQGMTVASTVGAGPADGTLDWEDDFARVFLDAALEVQDTFGVTGRVLSQAFTGDRMGINEAAAKHYWLLERESGSPLDAARLGGPIAFDSAAQKWGFHISQRPADDPVKQHRRIDVQLSTGDTTFDRELGIFLHGSFSDATRLQAADKAGKTGYLTVLRYDGASGTFSASLRHYDGVNAIELASADLTSHALTLGNVAAIDVEILNIGSSGGNSGSPGVRMQVNGATVTTWTVLVQGVAVTADLQWVVDSRSAATRSGSMEGFYAKVSKNTASPLAWVKSWTQQPFSSPPAPPSIWHASVPLGSETDGAFGTLTIPLSWPIVEVTGATVLDHAAESGHRQRIPNRTRPRRRWRVHAKALTATEKESLRTFFRDHKGTVLGFDWTPPRGAAPDKVHFVTEDLLPAMQGPDVASVEFELEELFDAAP